MSTGMRRFVDPLAALRRRSQWRLDALQHALAEALAELAATREACAALDAQRCALARRGALAPGAAIDPALRRPLLVALARLHDRSTPLLAACARQAERVDEVRGQVLAAQLALDALERLGQQALGEQRACARRRQAVEDDRGWQARCDRPRARETRP